MEATTSTSNEEQFPTEWHSLDIHAEVDVRQLSLDTYELRSPTRLLTLNKEGFNLYRDRSPAGQVIFNDWCKRHNVYPKYREN